jgi:hypothetical protein
MMMMIISHGWREMGKIQSPMFVNCLLGWPFLSKIHVKIQNVKMLMRIIIHTYHMMNHNFIIMNQWDGFINLILKMKTQNHL